MTKLVALGLAVALASLGAVAQARTTADYLSLDQYDKAQQAAAPKNVVSGVFEAVKGASLRATLERWAQMSGWQEVVWKLPPETDFTLGASGRFEGDFIAVTKAFVHALGAEADLLVTFHHANKVVVVEAKQ